jgi:hypothetical protein
MNFRERATSETSATMARALAAWSDHSRQELQSLRLALQAATDAAEAALADVSREPHTADFAALIDALTAAARAETEEAAARVAAEAQSEVDALRKELQARIDEQRKELQAKTDEQAKLTDALKEVRAEAYSVRAELGQRVDEIKTIRAELARAETVHVRLEEARQHAEAQVKLAQAEAEARLTEAHGRAQAQIEAEKQRSQSTISAIADEKRALEQQLKSLAEDLELSRLT